MLNKNESNHQRKMCPLITFRKQRKPYRYFQMSFYQRDFAQNVLSLVFGIFLYCNPYLVLIEYVAETCNKIDMRQNNVEQETKRQNFKH